MDTALKSIKDKRILITGGTGFLASHLAIKLLSSNAKIFLLDIVSPEKQPLLDKFSDKLSFVECNILDFKELEKKTKEISPQIIYHFGATLDRTRDFSKIDSIIDLNIKGTTNLLKSLIDIDYSSFILSSTSDVYGDLEPPFTEDMPLNPASPYSVSKLSAELFCRIFSKIYNKPYSIIRLFNIYGEGQSENMFIPQLIQSCIKVKDFNMTNGEQIREFNYVEDIVDALILSTSNEMKNQIINLGNSNPMSIRFIADSIVRKFNHNIKLNYGAYNYRENEIMEMYSDNNKAKKILNWSPKNSIEQGLTKTIKYFIEAENEK
tara:strand:+ start:21655 stop:22617 length:963 start_codon:yes stop_codon:yes gene_type:complete